MSVERWAALHGYNRMTSNHSAPSPSSGLLGRTVRTGTALSSVTLAAIAALSSIETGKPSAAINAISHCIHGDDRQFGDELSVSESAVGTAVNTMAMFAWSFLYEWLVGSRKFKRAILPAVLFTGAAYVIDYHIVPRRLSPGIEKRLTMGAVLGVYASMAVCLVSSSLWNRAPRAL